jgi:hypothetical protein
MIYKCLALFNLLPTSMPHHWLIAADWLEEEGLDITAAAFRENIFVLEIVNSNSNVSSGYGGVNGNGWGKGFDVAGGCGWGNGYGIADGGGEGDGEGEV